MKILRSHFGKIIISLFINIGLIYGLLYTISYSNFISTDYVTFPLLLTSPFLHIFLFLYLIKKFFKRNILSNIILYLITNSMHFLYLYLSYRFIYHHFYTYSPLPESGPTESDIIIDGFSNVYFMSKVSFILFIISILALVVAIIFRKYRNNSV